MKRRRNMTLGIACVVAALVVSGCASDDGDSEGASADSLSIFGCKPENALIPANTNEVCGGNILDSVFRGLVRYNPDTAEPENSLATSIESTDNINWTIKLRGGDTFQDGTPVTATSFVKAWNWAAYGPNGGLNNYFFADFDGYAALNPEDPDGEDGPQKPPTPTATELTGLKVVSDTEFTVKLDTPQSFFPVQLGYTVFAPLPEAFYKDTKAFGEKPIGDGPYQITAGDPSKGFTLTAWDGYKGTDKGSVKTAEFRTYQSEDAGYADLQAGNLDFMNQVPASALVNDQYQKDLPGHFVNKPVGVIQTMTLPTYVKGFNDPNLGKALSLAIDRDTITKSVYNGGRTPATGWVSPVVEGYKAGACGEYCTYDPAKAKTFLAAASFKGPFTYSYNADGPGNKEAAEAICNSIKNALAVGCEAKAYVDFSTLRADVNGNKMTSLFRTAWQMDYPAMQNFLQPLYFTGAGSNDGHYSNKEFDALITKANGEDGDAALATYQQAEAVLSQQMAVVPLWYQAQQSGWSKRLSNVKVTPFSTLDLSSVTVS